MRRAALLLAMLAAHDATPAPSTPPAPIAEANDNRRAAGRVESGVLTVRLVAAPARWQPLGASGATLELPAFAEEGRAPQVPAPLVRARVGARIRFVVRNTLADTLLLCLTPAVGCPSRDTLLIAPGSTRTVDHRASAVGSFAYGARLWRRGAPVERSQGLLPGALIVDPPAGPPRDERVIVITTWTELKHPADTTSTDEWFVAALNGRMWPHTERWDVATGDTVRWRIINASAAEHPMHLHGFYFRVDARGDGQRDTLYAPADRELAVTEDLVPFHSARITWSPERAGNWLFHCHDAFHMSGDQPYSLARQEAPKHFASDDGASHLAHDMSGLVIGIRVRDSRGAAAASPAAPARRLRLLVSERARYFGDETGLGFATQVGGDVASDSIVVPGPPLRLTRGEPVAITVVNRSGVRVSVHWHGIELESYYDGVPWWSGSTAAVKPAIAPGDSFVVRMTPPRAGTFIYHTHFDEVQQLSTGLYGALIVTEPGESPDPERERLFVLGVAGTGGAAPVVLNNRVTPDTVHLRRGTRYRFRFIDITAGDPADIVVMRADSTPLSWTPVAKDGARLPPSRRVAQPARFNIAPGETYDFEFDAPPGDHRLLLQSFNTLTATVRVP